MWKKILNETNFYSEYFDGYFKTGITTKDFLSHQNNVCKSLDRMATYLLTSDEIKKEEEQEKTEYIFIQMNGTFKRKLRKNNL
ncbi:hypothetical protein D0N41_22060 [Bacillus subtilis KCTC 1028 = ATCC 6051a]|nr:hypothetical protein D0N41_22060 [Bacillus subtilis KCTC 1028 = ATCC 6051a]